MNGSQPQPDDTVREKLHARIDAWLDSIADLMDSKPHVLNDMLSSAKLEIQLYCPAWDDDDCPYLDFQVVETVVRPDIEGRHPSKAWLKRQAQKAEGPTAQRC